ncbi:Ig-like domain-containing protein [Vibrio alginolyticus]
MSYFLHNNPFGGIIVLYDDGGGGGVINPVSVVINETISSLNVGDTGSLTATVSYSDSSQVNSADIPSIVNWSSSDESVLTVDISSNYEALNKGDVTVTATSAEDSSLTDSLTINVESSFDFEIIIGHHENESLKSAGFSGLASYGTYGEVISGAFPDNSEIVDAHAAASQHYLQSSNLSRWNNYERIAVLWKFEDDSEYESILTFDSSLGRYDADQKDELYEMFNARLEQSAKVKVSEYSVKTLLDGFFDDIAQRQKAQQMSRKHQN